MKKCTREWQKHRLQARPKKVCVGPNSPRPLTVAQDATSTRPLRHRTRLEIISLVVLVPVICKAVDEIAEAVKAICQHLH